MEDLWSQTRHSSAFSVERTSYRNGVSSLISNTGCNSSINIIHHPPVKRSIQKGCGRWSIFHQTSTYKGLLIKIWLSIRCTRRCDILDDPIASWPFHTQKKKKGSTFGLSIGICWVSRHCDLVIVAWMPVGVKPVRGFTGGHAYQIQII